MARLKDLGTIITGNTPKTSDLKNYATLDIPFVKPSDISDDDISYLYNSEFYISEYARDKARIIPVNSVLFTCIGIIGKVGINKVECAFNQQINAIIPNAEKCLSDYLVYALQSKKKILQETANAPVVPILNKTQFSDIEIPLPSLEEQEQISSKLNKIRDLIALKREQLNHLENLVKSRFIEMFGDPEINPFGWKISTLKEIAIGKLAYGSGAAAIDYDGLTRYVRITDITDKGELTNDYKSPQTVDKKYLLNNGDILFARTGATVGKTFQYKSVYGRCIYAGFLIRLIPDTTKVLPPYVFAFTKSDYYNKFVASTQRVVAQPNINAQEYGELKICIPPIDLQNQFAKFVEETDKLKFVVQQTLLIEKIRQFVYTIFNKNSTK